MSTEYTPDNITSLAPNEIFVFGSNEAGRHGLGAARLAFRRFGAIMGQGDGKMGQCYGISTKDDQFKTLPLHRIAPKILKFLRYAEAHPELKFLVTQIGCGLAGYKPKQIAPLFFSVSIPDNVVLPKQFWETLKPEEKH